MKSFGNLVQTKELSPSTVVKMFYDSYVFVIEGVFDIFTSTQKSQSHF